MSSMVIHASAAQYGTHVPFHLRLCCHYYHYDSVPDITTF